MPAAAVIREGQALFGMIGRKEFVGCINCFKLNLKLIFKMFKIHFYLSVVEDNRILYIGVKSNYL